MQPKCKPRWNNKSNSNACELQSNCIKMAKQIVSNETNISRCAETFHFCTMIYRVIVLCKRPPLRHAYNLIQNIIFPWCATPKRQQFHFNSTANERTWFSAQKKRSSIAINIWDNKRCKKKKKQQQLNKHAFSVNIQRHYTGINAKLHTVALTKAFTFGKFNGTMEKQTRTFDESLCVCLFGFENGSKPQNRCINFIAISFIAYLWCSLLGTSIGQILSHVKCINYWCSVCRFINIVDNNYACNRASSDSLEKFVCDRFVITTGI